MEFVLIFLGMLKYSFYQTKYIISFQIKLATASCDISKNLVPASYRKIQKSCQVEEKIDICTLFLRSVPISASPCPSYSKLFSSIARASCKK